MRTTNNIAMTERPSFHVRESTHHPRKGDRNKHPPLPSTYQINHSRWDIPRSKCIHAISRQTKRKKEDNEKEVVAGIAAVATHGWSLVVDRRRKVEWED